MIFIKTITNTNADISANTNININTDTTTKLQMHQPINPILPDSNTLTLRHTGAESAGWCAARARQHHTQ